MSTDPDAFRAFEIAGWQRAATAYCDFFAPLTRRLADPLLEAAAAGPNRRVLDVATGPGLVAASAAARGATVVGADIAPAMLARARRLHPALALARADVDHLPFHDRAFDAVVANFLVPHLARPQAALAELVRVVAGGGRLALTNWDVPARHRLMGVFVEAAEATGVQPPPDMPMGPPVFEYSRDDAFAALLAGAGLVAVRVETLAFTHRFAGPDAVWAGTLAATARTGPVIQAQPPAKRSEIRAAYDRLVAPYLQGGALELPISVKLASGQKP